MAEPTSHMRKSARKPQIYQHSVNFIICSPSQREWEGFGQSVDVVIKNVVFHRVFVDN